MKPVEIIFGEKLLKSLRAYYYKVIVDKDCVTHYEGSETATRGCRIRIYTSGWTYEEPLTFYSSQELSDYIDKFEKDDINEYFDNMGWNEYKIA